MKDFSNKVKNLGVFLKAFSKTPAFHSFIVNCKESNEILDFSKFLAKCLLCKYKTSLNACLDCDVCKKIESNLHPDVIFPERSGAMNTYNVATVRKIRLDSQILPNESKFKIYIFFDSQNISLSAQNAFLKTLEDAPEHAIFLFFCNNLEKVLPTVRSRSLIYNLEFLEIHEELRVEELAKKIMAFIKNKNELELIKLLGKVSKDRAFLRKVLLCMAVKVRLAISSKLKNVESDDLVLPGEFTFERLAFLGNVLDKTGDLLDKNVNFELLLAYFSSSLF